jgi:hypothetical protein
MIVRIGDVVDLAKAFTFNIFSLRNSNTVRSYRLSRPGSNTIRQLPRKDKARALSLVQEDA